MGLGMKKIMLRQLIRRSNDQEAADAILLERLDKLTEQVQLGSERAEALMTLVAELLERVKNVEAQPRQLVIQSPPSFPHFEPWSPKPQQPYIVPQWKLPEIVSSDLSPVSEEELLLLQTTINATKSSENGKK